MILADTSVWIDNLRRGNPRLASLLRDELIARAASALKLSA